MGSGREGWGWRFWRGRERKEGREVETEETEEDGGEEVGGRWSRSTWLGKLQASRALRAGVVWLVVHLPHLGVQLINN